MGIFYYIFRLFASLIFNKMAAMKHPAAKTGLFFCTHFGYLESDFMNLSLEICSFIRSEDELFIL